MSSRTINSAPLTCGSTRQTCTSVLPEKDRPWCKLELTACADRRNDLERPSDDERYLDYRYYLARAFLYRQA
jgi:hypothetical protein